LSIRSIHVAITSGRARADSIHAYNSDCIQQSSWARKLIAEVESYGSQWEDAKSIPKT
jgi:hypothetical protein